MSEEEYFQILKERVGREIRFNCPHYEEKHLKRRFAVRMRALDVAAYRDYLKILESDIEEYARLLKVLTVNVTEFFRNPETYDAIKEQVLPEIIRNSRTIRVWSSGCSDGKEPYSIAILLKEVLGNEMDKYQITIHASDIDEEALEKAEAGWYPANEMKGVGEDRLRKYFLEENGGYRARECLKRCIKFEHLDMLSDRKHTSLDMIICRNVVIYFNKEMKEKLYMDFYDALKYGGFLVLGKTETLFGEARDKFKIFNNIERIYRKL